MTYGHVISDLHLLAPWSAADDHLDEMYAAARRSDFFILNGDIFDFRWSALSSARRSVNAAIDWLRAFTAAAPQCRLFYILGNHDNLHGLAERLDALKLERENFDWRRSHLRIGDAMFTHGDLLFRSGTSDPFHRSLLPAIENKHRALSRAYHFLHGMRIHRLNASFYGEERCVRRVSRSLSRSGNGHMDGIADVYFGHVHMAFTDIAHDGLNFHNTGSVIQGLPWHMLEVEPTG